MSWMLKAKAGKEVRSDSNPTSGRNRTYPGLIPPMTMPDNKSSLPTKVGAVDAPTPAVVAPVPAPAPAPAQVPACAAPTKRSILPAEFPDCSAQPDVCRANKHEHFCLPTSIGPIHFYVCLHPGQRPFVRDPVHADRLLDLIVPHHGRTCVIEFRTSAKYGTYYADIRRLTIGLGDGNDTSPEFPIHPCVLKLTSTDANVDKYEWVVLEQARAPHASLDVLRTSYGWGQRYDGKVIK